MIGSLILIALGIIFFGLCLYVWTLDDYREWRR